MILDPTSPLLLSGRHMREGQLGARCRSLLIELYSGEDSNPQLPQHKGHDGQKGNNREDFTVMKRHGSSFKPSRQIFAANWTSIATNCKARWKLLRTGLLTEPRELRGVAREGCRRAGLWGRRRACARHESGSNGPSRLFHLSRPSRAAEARSSWPQLPVP